MKPEELKPGLEAQLRIMVEAQHTARYLGSGRRNVLGTPAIVAFVERAAQTAIDDCLPEGEESVGTHVDLQHEGATPMGMEIRVHVTLVDIQDRVLTFNCEVQDALEVIARGTHQRIFGKTGSMERLLKKKLNKKG